MSKTTVFQNMLVFRRAKVTAKAAVAPAVTAPRPTDEEEGMVTKKLVATPKPPAPRAESKTSEEPEKKPDGSSDVAAE